MAILRCKMCGGDMEIIQGSTVCECQYCGSKQTIPVADNEKKITLYERANRLRFNCEFDKATTVYESIISEFHEEAEAYWGNLLCKYGIEYVDDPADGHKIPTCHRSSFESIMEDPDFDMVMENADAASRSVYREQAKQIEEIRKGIIEVSGKEAPYDIFICYKETAEDGQRTIDSVIAQDVYDALTDKGYRVFFSRITLEDKLGMEYEPYIFAALNSAKIMLAFGTSYDYYQAVWVKNEWSRYIKLMSKDKSKHLIPCYKDIDAYDIPKEFTHLQAQDMGKIGAIQDLLRGIEKILPKEVKVKTVVPSIQIAAGGVNTEALLKRGNMSLEDGAFDEAKDIYNKVLDIEPENASAYLGLFMAEIKVQSKENAKLQYSVFDYSQNRYLNRARQFANSDLLSEFSEWEIFRGRLRVFGVLCSLLRTKKNEEIRIAKANELYNIAVDAMKNAKNQYDYENVANEFARLSGFRDADELCEECREKAKQEIKLAEEAKEKKHQENIEDFKSGQFHLTMEQQQEQDRLYAEVKRTASIAMKAEDNYFAMPDYIEKENLEKLLFSKQVYLEKLGIFKGKEKKLVRAEIDELRGKILQLEKQLSAAKNAVDERKADAKTCADAAEAYREKVNEENRKRVEYELMKCIGMTRLENGNITFGWWKYPQNKYMSLDDTSFTNSRPIEIEWRVLAREGTRVLVITEKAIGCKEYNKKYSQITWERCDLRKWLNDTFLNAAFSSTQRTHIQSINISVEENPFYHTEPGNMTNDKVFLLSVSEVRKYFSKGEDMQCKQDVYGVWGKVENSINCSWWLRTPGKTQQAAVIVGTQGYLDTEGESVYLEKGVRPAMWIDLCSCVLEPMEWTLPGVFLIP